MYRLSPVRTYAAIAPSEPYRGTIKFAQSKLDPAKQKAGYHRYGDTLPLCVLRLEARTYVSGEDAPVSASFLIDIPTGLGTAG